MQTIKIKKIVESNLKLLDKIFALDEMIKGKYHVVLTKCGKSNCRCATGKKHSHTRVTWSENGKAINRSAPAEDKDWLIQMTTQYRQYMKLVKKIKTAQNTLLCELEIQAKKIIKKTMKEKKYLVVKK